KGQPMHNHLPFRPAAAWAADGDLAESVASWHGDYVTTRLRFRATVMREIDAVALAEDGDKQVIGFIPRDVANLAQPLRLNAAGVAVPRRNTRMGALLVELIDSVNAACAPLSEVVGGDPSPVIVEGLDGGRDVAYPVQVHLIGDAAVLACAADPDAPGASMAEPLDAPDWRRLSDAEVDALVPTADAA